MKKFTLIAAMLLGSLAAFASGPADITGKYLDAGKDGKDCNTCHYITITKGTEQGAVKISGFFNCTSEIDGTYDASTGVLTIAPMQIIGEATDGTELSLLNVLYIADQNLNSYQTKTDITIQFNEDGNALFPENCGIGCVYYNSDGNLAIYAVDGKQLLKGNLGVGLYKVNGTITSDVLDVQGNPLDPTKFETAVVRDDNGGVIYGIDGYTWQRYYVGADNTITADQEDVFFFNDTYTKGHICNGIASGFDLYKGLTGTIDPDAGIITLDNWVVVLINQELGEGASYKGSKTKSVVTFPAPYSVQVGDVNEDTFIDIADLNKLINVVLGIDTANPKAADVNQDTFVDIADINALINLILGI